MTRKRDKRRRRKVAEAKSPDTAAMAAKAEAEDKAREAAREAATGPDAEMKKEMLRVDAMVARVRHNFKYHPPTDEQVQRMERFRERAKDLGELMIHSSPACREQSLAMTHLEEAVMWFNAAIARTESL